jgi:imidazolonepropionase-like amidohydrolase
LPHDAALRALTIEAAKILGIDKRVGSLERGKDADLALYNGDPFEYLTSATNVIINGKLLPATFE